MFLPDFGASLFGGWGPIKVPLVQAPGTGRHHQFGSLKSTKHHLEAYLRYAILAFEHCSCSTALIIAMTVIMLFATIIVLRLVAPAFFKP